MKKVFSIFLVFIICIGTLVGSTNKGCIDAQLVTLNYDEIKGNILDFGCGYGSIGIVVSKLTNLEVDMLDINKRSISLAQENSKLNKVKTNIMRR